VIDPQERIVASPSQAKIRRWPAASTSGSSARIPTSDAMSKNRRYDSWLPATLQCASR